MKTQKDDIKKPFGKPRIHDREAIFNKLSEWIKKEDSLNLCGFCAEIKISSKRISEWALEDEDLAETLQQAKDILASRREKKLSDGTLHAKAYDLNASTYDYFLKKEKRDQARFEASLREKEEVKIPLSDILKMAKDGSLTQK